MSIDNDRYEPTGFYLLALDYFKAAVSIMDAQDAHRLRLRFQHTVPYFLYTHSLELALKAFLRARGLSKRKLSSKEYGHDLKKLIAECTSRGMAVSEHGAIVVEWLNTFIEDHAFRYLRPGFQSLPGDVDVRQACEGILETVRVACEGVRDGAPSGR